MRIGTHIGYKIPPLRGYKSILTLGETTLPSDITFSRGTNATLTDSNGRIAWAPHNLLTNSEDFEAAAWVKLTGGTGIAPVVTSNAAVAPDGTSTADRIVFDRGAGTTSADISYINQSITAFTATATSSIYLMTTDGTTKQLQLRCGAPAAQVITVTGTWQRFQVTSTNATIDRLQLLHYGAGDDPAQTVSVYVWGAQLNVGSTAQSYNSTTPKNLLGFTQEPENAAWTKSNSYVQQNLLTWSQDFDNAAWVKTALNTTGTPPWVNVAVAPDGTTTAEKLTEDSANAAHSLSTSLTVTNGIAYTFSCYAKKAERKYLRLVGATNFVGSVNFDLDDGSFTITAGTPTVSVVNVGNGWYRCAITAVTAATTITPNITMALTSSGTGSYQGDGTSGIFIWGAQLVQGSTAGDYTQTTSAAAPTRYLNWDGTLTGRKLVEDTAAATTHRVFNGTGVTVPTNGAAANIVYAKAGERTAVRLTDNDIQGADFDLLTGAVSNLGTGVTASATNAGGGWWRLSVIRTNSTGTGRVVLYLISGGTITYTGDGTSGIYVSDFQLSNSTSVDPYVYNPQAAAASAAYYGPRFDYNPTGTPVLSGTELVTNGDFTNGTTGWTAVNSTIGVSSGELQVTNTGAVFGYAFQSIPTVIGRTYRVSIGIRIGTASSAFINIGTTQGGIQNFQASASSSQTVTGFFTATATTTFISPLNNNTSNGFSFFDNVSVQEVTGYTATANGLLIEEQRTNLLTYSEDFSNSAWQKVNSSITSNVGIAPDGTNTADKLIMAAGINPSAADASGVYQIGTITAATYTFSIYAKAAEFTSIRFREGAASGTFLTVDLLTGVITNGDAVQFVGPLATPVGNGWWRISFSSPSTMTTIQKYVVRAGSTGDGVSGFLVWGAQLEAGAFATSYVPTQASQVTRNADSASMLGDNFYTWYNPNQGTLNSDYIINNAQVAGAPGVASISDNTNNNRIQVSNVSGDRRAIVTSGGVVQFVAVGGALGAVSVGVAAKLAIAYRTSDFAACANAGTVVTQASGSVPGGLSRMYVGAAGDGNFQLNGTIRRIIYYNTRLPDSTLQALTTT